MPDLKGRGLDPLRPPERGDGDSRGYRAHIGQRVKLVPSLSSQAAVDGCGTWSRTRFARRHRVMSPRRGRISIPAVGGRASQSCTGLVGVWVRCLTARPTRVKMEQGAGCEPGLALAPGHCASSSTRNLYQGADSRWPPGREPSLPLHEVVETRGAAPRCAGVQNLPGPWTCPRSGGGSG